MKVLTPGHKYELENFEANGVNQTLQFIQKEAPGPIGQLTTVENGTTNEEVLAMLIDRMKVLNVRMPCRENSIVVTKLEEALMWLNKRTSERKSRGVEGTHRR